MDVTWEHEFELCLRDSVLLLREGLQGSAEEVGVQAGERGEGFDLEVVYARKEAEVPPGLGSGKNGVDRGGVGVAGEVSDFVDEGEHLTVEIFGLGDEEASLDGNDGETSLDNTGDGENGGDGEDEENDRNLAVGLSPLRPHRDLFIDDVRMDELVDAQQDRLCRQLPAKRQVDKLEDEVDRFGDIRHALLTDAEGVAKGSNIVRREPGGLSI
ncbi:uncharacterized protein MYCGRDRAFT_98028 [Zymoseptoria tritici IPO323]|uniref:Uncharacterized protein n=1 Tax=Zymoseptoria tritici (strain CBS 115943 / IPO323) TaxID=336722 RepID=F9XS39_ZYMTI|nr:uncharacterized protein MYCGRDRAFT_98028 [Zymoseptoria tritici IPO323]EGP81900.1 hypothetical protein MYCGRDRAFT_98028 [Zymoseptoria tritici IPO323]